MNDDTIHVCGGIEAVTDDTVTLWIEGVFSGLRETPITDAMPDWMLRPGALFCADIPCANFAEQTLGGVTWANIEPQPYADLSESELVDALFEAFRKVITVE